MTTATCLALAAVCLTPNVANAADNPAPMEQRAANSVTAQPLPTVQIDDGVVWSQAMIGNTVYAGGSFANARPSGASKGTSLVPRGNVLAYDIRTGVLNASFAPKVNGQVKVVAASDDGKRVYIGGTFTQVDGKAHYNVAALDATTGAVIDGFAPAVGGSYVNAIAVNGPTIYLGGLFTAVNGQSRRNVAAVTSAGRALSWAPTTDQQVDAMVLTAKKDKLIIGGRFGQVNNTSQRGMAALDLTDGAMLPWAVTQAVRNGGTPVDNPKAGITALAADDSAVYGTGWVYGNTETGNLEGAFSADPQTGAVRWIEDCHGDTYDVYSDGTQVYTVGHAHDCESVGGFPEGKPRWHHQSIAFTAAAKGTLARSPRVGSLYLDWSGRPSPAMIDWFPQWIVGSYTGQHQAGWSVTGNGQYLSIGGEFPGVNNNPQYGLVRFGTSAAAGADAQGPRVPRADWPSSAKTAVEGATVTVQANWDRDDLTLTYELFRDDGAKAVATTTAKSTFWNRPTVTLNDPAAPVGTHDYKVAVSDPAGNRVVSQSSSAEVTKSGIVTPAPTAAVRSTVKDLTVIFDADESTAATGLTVTSYDWDFGDGATGTGISATHTYAEAGTYTAMLTVTDSAGQTGTATKSVTVTAKSETPPTAVFRSKVSGLTVSVDGAKSTSDPAQPLNGWAWDFGDGSKATGVTATHTYEKAGKYTLTLSVVDAAGRTATVSKRVKVTSPAEVVAPTAVITATPDAKDGSTWAFSGANSKVGNGGAITTYSWSIEDGKTVSGETVTHRFAKNGVYPVTLTVTDAAGRTASTTEQITVTAEVVPPASALAWDDFQRATMSGWGEAPRGGLWAVAPGVPPVADGHGTLSLLGGFASPHAVLASFANPNVNGTIDIAFDGLPSKGAVSGGLATHVGDSGHYRVALQADAQGKAKALLVRRAGPVDVVLATKEIGACKPGQTFKMRIQTTTDSGVTTISGKVWDASESEPSAWLVTSKDSSVAIGGQGGIGVFTTASGVPKLSAVKVSVDNLNVAKP